MKKSTLSLLLFTFLLPLAHAQKVRYGQGLPKARPGVDYPLTLHISALRVRTQCPNDNNCADVVYADATVSGKKIELESDFGLYMTYSRDMKSPLLGDVPARIISKPPGAGLNTIGLRYELLLPDKSILRCTVSGVFE